MNWENLVGAVVDGRFRLRKLTYAGRNQAEFMADSMAKPGAGPLTLTLLAAAGEEFTQIREQLSRAAQLKHPGLLEIAGAGAWRGASGEELLYLASEAPEETLAAACPVTADTLRGVLRDILPGLKFLHGQGLVHRGVEPQAVVRAGGRWKLADYGRMQRAGQPDPQIGLYLNGSRYTPPEAYSGLVLPAWDLWDLGSLVLEALTGRPDEGVLPQPPFDAVVRGCLEAAPEARLGVDGVRDLLGLTAEPAPPPLPAPEESVEAEAAPGAPAIDDRWETPAPAPRAKWPGTPRQQWALAAGLAALLAFIVFIGAQRRAEPVSVPKSAPPPAHARAVASRPQAMPAHPRPVAAAVKTEVGMADYASTGRHGLRTASGERYDSRGLTAAHRSYPLGSRVRVTNLKNGRSVVVRINDRGLHRKGYVIRVTRHVAEELKFASAGSAKVRLEELN